MFEDVEMGASLTCQPFRGDVIEAAQDYSNKMSAFGESSNKYLGDSR